MPSIKNEPLIYFRFFGIKIMFLKFMSLFVLIILKLDFLIIEQKCLIITLWNIRVL
jgi:hypothetical protein